MVIFVNSHTLSEWRLAAVQSGRSSQGEQRSVCVCVCVCQRSGKVECSFRPGVLKPAVRLNANSSFSQTGRPRDTLLFSRLDLSSSATSLLLSLSCVSLRHCLSLAIFGLCVSLFALFLFLFSSVFLVSMSLCCSIALEYIAFLLIFDVNDHILYFAQILKILLCMLLGSWLSQIELFFFSSPIQCIPCCEKMFNLLTFFSFCVCLILN